MERGGYLTLKLISIRYCYELKKEESKRRHKNKINFLYIHIYFKFLYITISELRVIQRVRLRT